MTKKAVIIALPIIFTAQACDLLSSEKSDSGPRGIFLSVDSGSSWRSAGALGQKNLAGYAISSMFIESGNPRNLLASATGAGILATDSHGDKWAALLPDFSASDVFINSVNSGEIFAAGSRGGMAAILKSPDRGATWLQIYNEPSGQAAVTSLTQDGANPAILYAGLSSGTVLKSFDSGVSWNVLTDVEDRVVKIAAASDGKTVYMLTRKAGLHRSADSGRTWQLVNVAGPSSSYYCLILDSQNQSVAYVGAVSGLFRSTDAGRSWNRLLLPATPEINEVTAAAVNPKNSVQIFAAIRSTIYRSDDNGSSWRTVQLPTDRRVSSLVIDPQEPNRIYAGLR